MKYYCQRNYPDIRLGFGSTTIASHGCFLVSLSMMVGKDPIKVNKILKEAGAFHGDLIISRKAASALGLDYLGKSSTQATWEPSIMEVDMSPAPGKQQHFVVWRKNKIVDPWTGSEKPLNTYPLVSYRLFKNSNINMDKTYYVKSELRNYLKDTIDKDFDHTKSSHHKRMAGDLKKCIDELENLADLFKGDVAILAKQIEKLKIDKKDLIKAGHIMNETIVDLEEKLKTSKESGSVHNLVNSFHLGKWLFKIYSKNEINNPKIKN